MLYGDTFVIMLVITGMVIIYDGDNGDGNFVDNCSDGDDGNGDGNDVHNDSDGDCGNDDQDGGDYCDI